jgi:SNF2 family DNA or RNA helicase
MYVLRRTKKQVGIIIPDLSEKKEIVSWKTEEERKMSFAIHNQLKGASIDKLRTILLAQKICTLPTLLTVNVSKEQNERTSQITLLKSLSTSKMDAVIETILERKDNGAGKIIFCRFIAEIDEVLKRLQLGGMSCVANLDGRVKKKKDKIGRLNDKYEALVVQIQTGCEGLNLQKNYSEVYFVSPNWNPAIEAQAIARCHRIGQELPVFVFRFEMMQLQQLRLQSSSPQLLKEFGEDENNGDSKRNLEDENNGDSKRNLEDGDFLSNCRSMDHYVNTVQDRKKSLIAEMFT